MQWLGSRALLRFQNCHNGLRAAQVLLSLTSDKWLALIQAERKSWLQTQNSFLEPVSLLKSHLERIPPERLSSVLDVGQSVPFSEF